MGSSSRHGAVGTWQGARSGSWGAGRAYLLAFLLTTATLALRLGLEPAFQERPFMSLFLFPIIVSAFVGGLGPGLLATLLSALAVDFFLVAPIHSLQIAKGIDLFQLVFLVANGALVSALTEVLHRSRERLAAMLAEAQARFEADLLARQAEAATDHRQAEAALAAKEEEHRTLEAELVQLQKLESVGRLAGGVAHDFNNMLGVILGQAEVAMMMPGAKPLQSFLTEIIKAARRSGELTRQLLAFARKQIITPKVLDLNGTIKGMLKMLGRLIGEDITLTFVNKDGLWPVRVDPAQIDQILANLTVNARDAIHGVGTVAIVLDNVVVDAALCRDHPAAVEGEFVELAVADSGCGMEPEIVERMFEPFFTTKPVGQGTGLGLATVLGIVKQNDGFILVQSAPGAGTRFRIFLPRHREVPEGGAGAAEPRMPSGRGQTILLVEDDAAVLNATRILLEQLGYKVVPVLGPGEALAFLDTFRAPLDLLLTDVVMPNMNGRELADRILDLRPGLPVLFMSGYTADILAPHGVLDGQTRFVQKPASLATLAQAVHGVFSPLV